MSIVKHQSKSIAAKLSGIDDKSQASDPVSAMAGTRNYDFLVSPGHATVTQGSNMLMMSAVDQVAAHRRLWRRQIMLSP